MYLMYVDESGNTGLGGSDFFVLSGLVVHESKWHASLNHLIAFRRAMRLRFGLKLREEIHANAFMFKPGALIRIPRNDRLTILRHFIDHIEQMPGLDMINIAVDKTTKAAGYDVFHMAWTALIQRLENTIGYGNFRVCARGENGLILADPTNTRLLTQRLRKMRHFNPVPNTPAFGPGYRNLQLAAIVEDPVFRDSAHSFFIQAADTVAWMLTQKLKPSSYIRKKSGHGYFDRLNVTLCRHASKSDPQGIVRL